MTLYKWQRSIVDESGNVIEGASVEIRKTSDGALASIYTNKSGSTPKANPFTTPESGFAFAYLAAGSYTFKASSGGQEIEWSDFTVGTAEKNIDGVTLATANDISAIESDIEGIENDIIEIEENIIEVEGDIDQLQLDVGELQTDVGTLSGSVGDALSLANAALSGLATKADFIGSVLAANAEEDLTLKADADQNILFLIDEDEIGKINVDGLLINSKTIKSFGSSGANGLLTGGDANNCLHIYRNSSGLNILQSLASGSAAALFLNPSGGSVNIGTTTDDGANRLQVSGGAKITGSISLTGSSANHFIRSGTAWAWTLDGTSTGTLYGGCYANSTGWRAWGGATIADHLVVNSSGRILIGGAVDDTGSRLQVVGTGRFQSGIIALLLGANSDSINLSTNATKFSRIGAPHYDLTQLPAAWGIVVSNATDNELRLGGGTTSMNTATMIRFFTAANTTTPSGTEAMRITSGQRVLIGTSTDDGTNRLQVSGSMITSGDITMGAGSGQKFFVINGGASTDRGFMLRTAGSSRWFVGATSTAESGSDAGTNFIILPYTDAAALKAIAFAINRATGNVTIGKGPTNDDGNKLQVNGSARIGGALHFAPGASVTPANNGDVVIEFTNNTTLTFKAKGNDGTIRSATVTLS